MFRMPRAEKNSASIHNEAVQTTLKLRLVGARFRRGNYRKKSQEQ